MDDLDQWLARERLDEPSLDRLEHDVWGRVRDLRTAQAQSRLRVVAVVVALSVGVANGGLGASLAHTSASEMSVFGVSSLSPLVRLEVD
ncbi:MAG: hypothetical protein J0M36_13085 [Caulobacterales bacterium]|nr:hypothetical protein [Caulobacterales bacterium]